MRPSHLHWESDPISTRAQELGILITPNWREVMFSEHPSGLRSTTQTLHIDPLSRLMPPCNTVTRIHNRHNNAQADLCSATIMCIPYPTLG